MTPERKKQIAHLIFINRHSTFLASCDKAQPVIRAMSPVVDDALNLWMVTDADSRKVAQLENNPRVCVECAETVNWTSEVTIFGKVERSDDMDEKRRVWELATEDVRAFFPGDFTAASFLLYRIHIEKIIWRDGSEHGEEIVER